MRDIDDIISKSESFELHMKRKGEYYLTIFNDDLDPFTFTAPSLDRVFALAAKAMNGENVSRCRHCDDATTFHDSIVASPRCNTAYPYPKFKYLITSYETVEVSPDGEILPDEESNTESILADLCNIINKFDYDSDGGASLVLSCNNIRVNMPDKYLFICNDSLAVEADLRSTIGNVHDYNLRIMTNAR